MMNKRGQTMGFAIITAIFIFLIGFTVLNLIKPVVTDARSVENGLDCSNNSISDGTKLTCLAVDTTIPYFILIIISLAGGLITARLSF